MFEGYLYNRKQKIMVDEAVRVASIVKCGVPKGTLLSKTLFIYQHDLLYQLLIKRKMVSNVNDTAFLFETESRSDVINEANYSVKISVFL